MDLSEEDRNKLRASQHKLHDQTIGKIIEHQIQDPKKYKLISGYLNENKETQSQDFNQAPKIIYKGTHYNEETIRETGLDQDLSDLPISIKEVQQNQWLSMNHVELDKLEWMTSKAEKARQEHLNRTTQFDINGRAIPPKCGDQVSKIKTEEIISTKPSESETHDIEALVSMLDSEFDPQVTYSLDVIAKIANLATMGYYDGSFDENIHSVLLKSCLLRVRHRLDHTNESICQRAIKCLCALICNCQLDEIFLDRMFPLTSRDNDPNIWLQTSDMQSKKFTIEMKDSECLEIDIIQTLVLRTDLITRLIYLLKTKSSLHYYTYQECILDILIRLARHSVDICLLLLRSDLLSILVDDNFLPVYSETEKKFVKPVTCKTLKLIRILSQATSEAKLSHRNVPSKIPKNIIPSIESYFFINCFSLSTGESDNLLKLHIETLRIMVTLWDKEEFKQDIASLMAMGREHLFTNMKSFSQFDSTKPINSKVSFDWQYSAHLINLVGVYMQHEYRYANDAFSGRLWTNYLRPVTLRWFNDIISQKAVPHIDVSITIATSIKLFGSSEESNRDLLHIMIDADSHELIRRQSKGIDYFKFLLRIAMINSQLSSNFLEKNGRLRDPKSLPSYGFLNFCSSKKFEMSLNSVIDVNSPYILINSFISKLLERSSYLLNNMNQLVNSVDFIRYLRSFADYYTLPSSYEQQVHQSLTAQFELIIMSKSLLCLSRYYLENVEPEDNGEQTIISIIEETKNECYGNIVFYAIAIMGLLNPAAEMTVKLKDQILQNIMFNQKLQNLVYLEGYTWRPKAESLTLPMIDFVNGCKSQDNITAKNLRAIGPVYLSCDQPDRYWIFQPLIEYYLDHQVTEKSIEKSKLECHISSNSDTKRWFLHVLDPFYSTTDLHCLDDAGVVELILKFNYLQMRLSAPYSKIAITSNIEDTLCVIGTIFLDDNLFLNEGVSKMMVSNIHFILSECLDEAMGNFPKIFQDASSFIRPLNMTLADYFNKLIDQYESASYADLAFSNFVILFLTQYSDIIFRRKLFQEKTETCISLLGRIGGDMVWIPRKFFETKKESDPGMKDLLRRAGPYITETSFLRAYRSFNLS